MLLLTHLLLASFGLAQGRSQPADPPLMAPSDSSWGRTPPAPPPSPANSAWSPPPQADPPSTTMVLPEELPALRPALTRGLLELCLGLERFSDKLKTRENTVLAPVSIAAIAALLLAGSAGVTKKELTALFGIQNIIHKEEELHRALGGLFSELESAHNAANTLSYGSAMFIQQGEEISKNYLSLATDVYRSQVFSMDFKKGAYNSSMFINKWVSNRTEGRIERVLEDVVEPSTVMIIANVFFFRGVWEQPFVKKYTKMQKFFVSEREVLPIPLMVSLLQAQYGRVRGSHTIVGLPYKGSQVSMFFILPDGDLGDFVTRLTPEALGGMLNQTVQQSTIVAIPRMRVEGSLELSGALSSLGVRTLFSPRQADLSRIAKGVYLNEMHHKVSIEVTESGTVGAAATAVTVLRDGSTPLFRADRPFLFFIYHHQTGSVVFWGTVFKPQPILEEQ